MSRARHGASFALATIASLLFAVSCDENLPSGPNTFAGALRIVVPRDTLVVGDSSQASAEATDAQGRRIQDLEFTWTSADANVLGVVNPAAGDTSGRAKVFIGRRPG